MRSDEANALERLLERQEIDAGRYRLLREQSAQPKAGNFAVIMLTATGAIRIGADLDKVIDTIARSRPAGDAIAPIHCEVQGAPDEDGYPDEEQLERIAKWDWSDIPGLLEYVRTLWNWAPTHFLQDRRIYTLYTGGWSGNESLIAALQKNMPFWVLCWQLSKRGGHYEFELPESLGEVHTGQAHTQ